ncbi:helix-turn-helix transcriptional regulator [Peptostreptococcus russellii]|uniref:Helix-turn-helix domain-containing protein n=1 Tax=Peptostreptococcus russellii TaxID=215200 RepID=A0A1H8ERT1_9FIRM|nr:AraC family transcriptional regulator [Peptostreptococcus russellii]MBC2577469.1 helix-turn-helix transcriptional regulator [Peptostreptococcus russellii]SEN22203.1 Helix-turn-helix domain-containing protein [Peptostreptococcus russellii]
MDNLNILDKEEIVDININYKALCENLVRGNFENSYIEFERCISSWIEKNNLVVFRAFLNSLNYAIYYYVLYTYNKTFNRSCIHCTMLMHREINKDNVIKIARSIIDEYYDEMIEERIIVTNPLLQEVFELIEDKISEIINLDLIAKEIHVNKSYLSKTFKANTGYTFSEYVNNRKINRARNLLINSEKTISQICKECGYKNTTYFSSLFSKKTGFSPTSFRKNSSNFKENIK